jgi:hypothetical protein
MARVLPSLPISHILTGGQRAELSLLRTLEEGLSNAYVLFHGVNWSRGSGDMEQHGELDLVVVNQSGDTLLIEVKAGPVDFGSHGIFKTYSRETKDVGRQIGLQWGALRGRLNDIEPSIKLHHLLVLPDVRVQSETVQWPRERIVDSQEVALICARISELLGPGRANPKLSDRVNAFFENRFQVQPDVSALLGRLQQEATTLSSGLATWVPRIEVPSGIVRVVGTAGSGKTQLALKLLKDAVSSKRAAAYICFNRALADHIAKVAPAQTPVETFHEYAVRVLRTAGTPVDFKQSNAFADIERNCILQLENLAPDLDVLVIDEMQDLKPQWVEALLSRLREDGTVFLLEDPDQQLYPDREEFELPQGITITSHENFRSPHALVKLINGLALATADIEAKGPHAGELPDPIVYDRPEVLEDCTVKAVKRCLDRGFNLEDIAVISMRGREKSLLQKLDHLGAWTVKRFTGAFDEGENPEWTSGELLVESVRRFKGQAAPAVVFTECDFDELTAINRRLLFVGITRARVHLEWVISENTERFLKLKMNPS